MHCRLVGLLSQLLLFKLGWGEVAKRGMNALMHVDLIEKSPQLADGISVILMLGQVNFLLFDGTDEPLSLAILLSCSHPCHTDLYSSLLQLCCIGAGCILLTWEI
jgi:hypothetical protein